MVGWGTLNGVGALGWSRGTGVRYQTRDGVPDKRWDSRHGDGVPDKRWGSRYGNGVPDMGMGF